jgi:hypothetical protein
MRTLALVGAAMLALASIAAAAEETAESFVNAIYAQYKPEAKKPQGVRLDTDAAIRKIFEPSLAALIIADNAAAKKNDDIPTLDGDPFVDAQDWKITNVVISVAHDGADKAAATVNFKNLGKATVVKLQLVKTPAGWRVADVVWPGDEGNLRGLYKN